MFKRASRPVAKPRAWAALACTAIALALSGCEKAMQDMYNQPRYKPLGASAFWPDGRASRPEVAGAIAYSGGASAGTSSGRLGVLPLPVQQAPTYPVDDAGRVKADLAPASAQPLVASTATRAAASRKGLAEGERRTRRHHTSGAASSAARPGAA